jgi:DNA-binding MarR family transcriptional regulator
VPDRNELLREVFETMSLMKRAMHGHFSHAFDSSKLSPSQMQLLTIISLKQPVSHKVLAHKMQLTPGAVSQLLDGLAEEHCITRTQSEADRRINYVSITKVGKRKLTEFNKLRKQILTKAFSALTDHELQNYLTVQQKMLRYFEDNRPTN